MKRCLEATRKGQKRCRPRLNWKIRKIEEVQVKRKVNASGNWHITTAHYNNITLDM